MALSFFGNWYDTEMERIKFKIVSFLRANKITILALFTAFIVAETISKRLSSDLVIFSVLLCYGCFIKMFRIKSAFTFFLCLGLLMLMYILYVISGTSISTEKAAVWLILFFGIGVIQQWRE